MASSYPFLTTNILVCGGRTYADKARVWWHLEQASNYYGDIVIIEGGARGADAHAREFASRLGHVSITYNAPWLFAHKEGGTIRNRWMLQYANPHVVLAFPGGTGTAHMTRIATEAGIPVYQCR